jgi:hypothetical protein
MSETTGEAPVHIGWARAIATTVIITVVAVGVLVYGTNAILTNVRSLSRSSRVALATVWFFVALGALAWAMRVLQRRRVL